MLTKFISLSNSSEESRHFREFFTKNYSSRLNLLQAAPNRTIYSAKETCCFNRLIRTISCLIGTKKIVRKRHAVRTISFFFSASKNQK